ncbi:hypothetical protein V1478_010301 [Vespula squamosa]|uniref:Uncharacterized protein n=1 Tax=Vespula squamosa TaxID=30214 RepID=A0ABD2AK28_VESSQ
MNHDIKSQHTVTFIFIEHRIKHQCSFALPYRNKESLQSVHKLQLTTILIIVSFMALHSKYNEWTTESAKEDHIIAHITILLYNTAFICRHFCSIRNNRNIAISFMISVMSHRSLIYSCYLCKWSNANVKENKQINHKACKCNTFKSVVRRRKLTFVTIFMFLKNLIVKRFYRFITHFANFFPTLSVLLLALTFQSVYAFEYTFYTN